MIYLAADSSPGKPRAGYLERILESAVYHKFPESYVKGLESWRR